MDTVEIFFKRFSGRLIRYLMILPGVLWGGTLYAQTDAQPLYVGLAQSRVIDFVEPVKRVSIANPEIADAAVASPTQILVNGLSLGQTTLIVWDSRERYKTYKVIVHNEKALYQVMLRVHFAEVRLGALKEYGVNFLFTDKKIGSETVTVGSFAGKVSSPGVPLPLSEAVDLFLAIPSQNFAAVVKALEEKSLLTVLAKPNLSALNGGEASFHAGGEFPVPVASGGVGGQQTVTIQWKEFGVRLKFIPTVIDSNLVNISVSTEVSSLDFENGVVLSGFQVPALVTRKAQTSIELREGENFVIGGLLTEDIARSVSRLPVLGSIPVLGKLFSSTRYLNNESELIVMISPDIIPGAGLLR